MIVQKIIQFSVFSGPTETFVEMNARAFWAKQAGHPADVNTIVVIKENEPTVGSRACVYQPLGQSRRQQWQVDWAGSPFLNMDPFSHRDHLLIQD